MENENDSEKPGSSGLTQNILKIKIEPESPKKIN